MKSGELHVSFFIFYLNNTDICIDFFFNWFTSYPRDPVLDGICYMRDNYKHKEQKLIIKLIYKLRL